MANLHNTSAIEIRETIKIMDKETDRTPINNFTSSTSLENEVCNEYQNVPESSTHLSVTTVLHYCKSKILNPYMRLLSFMGLRPLISEQQEPYLVLQILNYAYTFQVVGFMLIGYFLQYMSCFRRDRGFCYKTKSSIFVGNELDTTYEQTCDGSLIFSFVIPSMLHLIGYIHAVAIFRSSDDNQLPVLMERVFLSSTNLSNGFMSQRRLVKMLWLFVIFSIIWMILSLVSVNSMMAKGGDINFKWMQNSSPWIIVMMKILLIICTLWHDVVQATVISNYCLQAQLLTSYVQFLREKLLQYPVQPLEWMRVETNVCLNANVAVTRGFMCKIRCLNVNLHNPFKCNYSRQYFEDIEDFKKLLKYLNDEIAPSVCLFTIVNLSFTFSGILWLFNFDHIDRKTLPIFGLSVLNVVLWIFISVAPFIQGTRLSNACNVLKTVGQEVRTRPYVHQDTPAYELDSILMYTTSLKISAQLFYLPIKGKNFCFCFVIATIVILVLGQCHYLNT